MTTRTTFRDHIQRQREVFADQPHRRRRLVLGVLGDPEPVVDRDRRGAGGWVGQLLPGGVPPRAGRQPHPGPAGGLAVPGPGRHAAPARNPIRLPAAEQAAQRGAGQDVAGVAGSAGACRYWRIRIKAGARCSGLRRGSPPSHAGGWNSGMPLAISIRQSEWWRSRWWRPHKATQLPTLVGP
jgi:hypothetical protein